MHQPEEIALKHHQPGKQHMSETMMINIKREGSLAL